MESQVLIQILCIREHSRTPVRILTTSHRLIFFISGGLASSLSRLEEEERLMMERVVGEGGLVMSRVEGEGTGEYQAGAHTSSMSVTHTVTGPRSKNKQRNASEPGPGRLTVDRAE